MLAGIPVSPRKTDEYRTIVGDRVIDDLVQKAAHLKGLKVLNISSTAVGGGVAELLFTKIPLMNDLGMDIKWQIISGDTAFFTVTKNIHNGLQGMDFLLTDHMKDIYEERSKINAQALETDADIIVIHDPQPLGLINFVPEEERKKHKWIWRAHLDLTRPMPEVLEYISRYTLLFDLVVVTLDEYLKPQMKIKESIQLTPTIDPLSPKNNQLSEESMREILQQLDIDRNRPTLTQVSRFDPWKDPFGVIDTYRLAKKEIPDLQLLMVASMATDDPEGWHYFEKTARYAGLDPSIKFFSNVTGVGSVAVNAIQRASDAIIQKSKREGFGLVVSEAMWKNKPVIGTKVGGIKIQIQDSVNGFLIDTTEEAAEKVVYLLKNKEKERELGQNAHQYVRQYFLTPTALSNWLDVFSKLAAGQPVVG